jgi:hypothetical protein
VNVLTQNKLQTLTCSADTNAAVVHDSQYVVVTTVLVTLLQQQKISFTNYSMAISHINEGLKNQCFRGLLCPDHQG